jgi:hypothetical protein
VAHHLRKPALASPVEVTVMGSEDEEDIIDSALELG